MNDMDIGPDVNPVTDVITGKVMYIPDNSIMPLPIEHIKVTFEWGDNIPDDIKYTSGDGIFAVEIPASIHAREFPVSITLEDIDGEENGGLFESFTDNIIYSYPDSSSEPLVYRLNHATVSGSSPQF